MVERVQDDLPQAPYFIQSLERGLEVILSLAEEQGGLTLSEVARRSGINRAAARRCLLTLADLGYVSVEGRTFSLTPRTLALGYAYLSSQPLATIAGPHLERLVAEVDESVSVGVLDGPDVVYIARITTRRIMAALINVGTRFPAHASSTGRVLLAYLPPDDFDAYLATSSREQLTPATLTEPDDLRRDAAQVLDQGYVILDGELEVGLRSVAVPIRDGSGQVIAAVNIGSQASRVSIEDLGERFLKHLQETVAAIEAELSLIGTVDR